jgi:hypothetical protein
MFYVYCMYVCMWILLISSITFLYEFQVLAYWRNFPSLSHCPDWSLTFFFFLTHFLCLLSLAVLFFLIYFAFSFLPSTNNYTTRHDREFVRINIVSFSVKYYLLCCIILPLSTRTVLLTPSSTEVAIPRPIRAAVCNNMTPTRKVHSWLHFYFVMHAL